MKRNHLGKGAQPFEGLVEEFKRGNHGVVVDRLRVLLRQRPDFAPGFKLLGSALLQLGEVDDAVAALRQAVVLAPDDAQTHSNLGNALAALGQLEPALAAHREAIRRQPQRSSFYYNLGCVFLQKGEKTEALREFLQAFDCAPQDGDLAKLCRELFLEIGDEAGGEAFCRLNLGHLPSDAGAWAMLGGLLLNDPSASKAEALAALREASRLEPADAAVWSNLSVALRYKTEWSAAIEAGERAVALAPEWGNAYNNLGIALRDAGRWHEAKAAFLAALNKDEACAPAYYNLGCICMDLGEHELAREGYIEAVKCEPNFAWLLQGAHACRQLADWEGAELLEGEMERQLSLADGKASLGEELPSPFAYLTTPSTSAAQQLQIASQFAAQFADRIPLPPRLPVKDEKQLRIGLLSSDFRDHATAHLMTGVLEAINPGRFCLLAYDYSPPGDDAYRDRLHRVIPYWTNLASLSDEQAAQRIRADDVDILIDLKGWTQASRGGILAYRPAPVQIQWLGFPGTMGASWVDYILADSVVIPPGAENDYAEKVLRLPGCYQPNDVKRAEAKPFPRRELGLPEQAFVLAAFHQPYKITRKTFALWLRLLNQIPDSVLWLLEAPPMARENLCHAAQSAGVDLARLVWAPRLPLEAHLSRFAAADLALDSFPVNAHTTASDALWAGVPQVARCGETFVSRVSASIVRAAGLGQLVAFNDSDYENLVLRLAGDRGYLEQIRQGLAENRLSCPLFNTELFSRHLEAGLEMVCERHMAGLAPDHLVVPT